MKKKRLSYYPTEVGWLKLARIMKLIAFLVFVFVFDVSASVYSQNSKISVKIENGTLSEIFNKIEEQSEYRFFYQNEQIKKIEKKTVEVSDKNISDLVSSLLENTGLTYKMVDRNIIIYPESDAGKYAVNRDQSIPVSGRVTDSSGVPLPGVTVVVKGTTIGAITDSEGKYFLKDVSRDASLVFSFVGMRTQEMLVSGKTVVNVTLQEETVGIEEVVAVGYGTQKKVNLTGSVSTVDFEKEALSRPVTTAAAALSGMSAGLQVMQASGRPNGESVSIKIRGLGTLNDSDPLVLIDGMEASLSDINPNDIASISILKDAASCAIYGNRGANGVILITSKTGKKGKVTVTYSGKFSLNTPANLVRMVSNYGDYMEFMNESAENVGQADIYSEATIDQWREAEKNPNGIAESGYPNYVAYPNTDWYDVIFKNKLMQEHTVSVLGQEEHTKYNFSGTYMDNPGLIVNSGVKKYYLRSNISSDITDWLRVGTRLWGYHTDQDRNDVSNLTAWSFRKTVPGIYPYYDGKYGGVESNEEDPAAGNPILNINGNGDSYYKYNQIFATVFANVRFLKDFSYDISFDYDRYETQHKYTDGSNSTYSFSRGQVVQAATSTDQISTYLYSKDYSKWKFTQLLKWNHTFRKHDISAMAGFEEEHYLENYSDIQKQGVLDPSITDLSSVTTMKYINGARSEYASRSYFGRATYAYNSRYLFEANLRYDGSSRFSSENRWGVFPSLSVGWRLSQEAFMKNAHIDDLKLRASWGKLGNNSIGNYDWQSTYSSAYYSFAGTKTSALAQSTLANSHLKWETTTITDLGADFAFLNNRFSAVVDYYNKETSGILYRPTIYLTMGNKTAPLENIAKVNNRGFEVTLGWKDKIGKLFYSVSGNFAYNKNEVTKYKGQLERGWTVDESGSKEYYTNLGDVSTGSENRIVEGKIINEFYMLNPYKGNGNYYNSDGSVNVKGGPKDGMIRTDDDMNWLKSMIDAGYTFYPNQQVGKDKIWYGDYIFADTNGDGIYGNSYDYDFQNCSTEPKYNFGLQASASWKGFDVSMNWAGATGFKIYWYEVGENSSATVYGLALGKKVAYNHYFYDPENPSDPRTNLTSRNARLSLNNGSDQSGSLLSSVHLYNCNFLKLKNLTFGYTLPKSISGKLHSESIRLYVSGENLLTITPFDGIDPEMRSGVGYAPLREYAFGVNVTF